MTSGYLLYRADREHLHYNTAFHWPVLVTRFAGMEKWARDFCFSNTSPQPFFLYSSCCASNFGDFWGFSFCHCQLGIQFLWVISVIYLHIHLITSFWKLVAIFVSPIPFLYLWFWVLKPKSLTLCTTLNTQTHTYSHTHTHSRTCTNILVGFQEGNEIRYVQSAVLTRNPDSFTFHSPVRYRCGYSHFTMKREAGKIIS